ncbi:MAG: 4-alpha-glucanotransferase, partial [Dehalococcoidales bacterium]|nr:4-alpha-glucanotransferase [Dehalococcoidales bacterium]
MSFPRASGILLHPTSLPGRFGIGDLGREAYRFADFLADTGQHLWQMLPLGPTGYDNSPYHSLSVFAGNPFLISLERLLEDNFLDPGDLARSPSFPENLVDYEAVAKFKMPLLRKSYETFEKRATPAQRQQLADFCQQNASWLDVYSLFMALREAHDLAIWNIWEADIRSRQSEAIERWSRKLSPEIRGCQYQQYRFFRQWAELKKYCNERGIKLIGDI